MFLEAFTLSIIIPLVSSFLSGPNNFFLTKIYYQYLPSFFGSSNIYFISMLLLTFFVIKLSFLLYALIYQTNFYIKFKIYLSEAIFKGYLKMPFKEHVKINSSLILRNTTIETESVAGIIRLTTQIITETLVLIGISVVLIIYQPIGSIVIISYISLTSYLFYLAFKKKLLNWGNLRQLHEGKRIQKINEGINGIKEVKLSKNLNFFFNSFREHNNISNDVHKKRTIIANLPKIWLEFILLIALLSLTITLFYLENDINYIVANLALFAAAAFRVLPSIQRILTSYQSIRFQIPAIDKTFNELNKFKKFETLINKSYMGFDKSIVFKNVTFFYPSKKQIKILENFSLDIQKGDFIGIVGKSGTGKTTFFNLLSGLISPSSGEILIDDNVLSSESINWTNKVGYVPQETFILDSSLRKNITLNDKLTDKDNNLNYILKSVNLDELINNLDEGLDTNIGESGQKISGGQRQRIGIARALYKNPSLLIFDEITSSLDKKTELKILDTINHLKKDKTILMISHREETLINCGKIYSFDKKEFLKK